MATEMRENWAEELIARAERVSSEDELKDVQREYGEYTEAQAALVKRFQLEAEADGRDRPHANDQRTIEKMAVKFAKVQMAVAQAIAIRAQATRNRQRIDAGGNTPAVDTRAVFPSMAEYKAQGIAGESGGGYLVPDVNANVFYDRLRPETVVLSAGPTVMTVDTEGTNLPKLSSSVVVVNSGEGTTITASDVAFQLVRLGMRKYATYTIGSSEWFSDAQPEPLRIIETDHRLQLAAALDNDMLAGSGSSNKILGLRNWPGITDTSLGAAGATPTLDNVLDALQRMQANNAKASALFMHPRTWNTLRKLKDSQQRYQLQPDPTTAARPSLFDVPVYLSSQISITEVKTSSTDCSYILAVDMSRIVVGQRSNMSVLYDPYSLSQKDQIAIRTTTRWGLAVLNEVSVELLSGVRP